MRAASVDICGRPLDPHGIARAGAVVSQHLFMIERLYFVYTRLTSGSAWVCVSGKVGCGEYGPGSRDIMFS